MNDILEEIENIAPKGFVSESQKCGKATKEDPIPKHAPLNTKYAPIKLITNFKKTINCNITDK